MKQKTSVDYQDILEGQDKKSSTTHDGRRLKLKYMNKMLLLSLHLLFAFRAPLRSSTEDNIKRIKQ